MVRKVGQMRGRKVRRNKGKEEEVQSKEKSRLNKGGKGKLWWGQ